MGRDAAMLLIVTDDDRLLLHLRDDVPGILHPGCWAGFGGALEPGESQLDGLRREVAEETGLELDEPRFLVDLVDAEGNADRVALFYVHGGIRPGDIDLREGAGIGVHAFDDLDELRLTPFVRRAIRDHLEPRIRSDPNPYPGIDATGRPPREPEPRQDAPRREPGPP